jgi:hypothetical protein
MEPSGARSPRFTEDERAAFGRPFAGGYKYLPIELFETDTGHYAFDVKNVCFVKTNRVGAAMHAVLRERRATLDELPDCSPAELQKNYADLLTRQAEGLLGPHHFRHVKKYDNSL